MEDLQQLEQLLKAHDWFYQRTEDRRVYKRGTQQRQNIFQIIRDLHDQNLGPEADELFNQYKRS
jgi:hypothetical protein|tara:strand:- start:720 stop:911 length:192 start_codon:yes stop_codon:yes gene_type:complete